MARSIGRAELTRLPLLSGLARKEKGLGRIVSNQELATVTYVGWHCRLTPKQLYQELRFTHYWAAYNLNSDQAPAIRGVQLRQSASKPVDVPPGVVIAFQADVVRTDALGGRPTVVAPENWLEV